MSEELKPCPYCGQVETVNGNPEVNIGWCTGCFGSYDPYVLNWNNRPIEDALRQENEILRETLSDIHGITWNRDGFATAESLGALVDEMHELAGECGRKLKALEEERKAGKQ